MHLGDNVYPNTILRIDLTIDSKWLPTVSALLSTGFEMHVQTGVTLHDVLCRQLGIASDYLEHRVKTVFLDSQAVDDINIAVVRDNSVVAISAAMPGLVGAIMRRGGLYAGFRNGISYQMTDEPNEIKSGTFRLKLFNLVAKELGPHFLSQGIHLDSYVWQSFLTGQPEDFKQGIITARVDSLPVEPEKLFARQWPEGTVHLTVNADR